MPSPSFPPDTNRDTKGKIEIESGTGPFQALKDKTVFTNVQHLCHGKKVCRVQPQPGAVCGAWSRTEWILVRFEGRRVACSTFLQGQSKRNSPGRWTFPLLTLVLD